MTQVEVNDIVDRHLISRMKEGINSLRSITQEWVKAGVISEVDWSRLRSLEFQEILRSRNSLIKELNQVQCTECPDFTEHVCPWNIFY